MLRLSSVSIPRCKRPDGFGVSTCIEVHSFSDASQDGYGVVCYVRHHNEREEVYFQFVMAKARVASLKQVSIPRLELVAAVLSVKVVAKVLKELVQLSAKCSLLDGQSSGSCVHCKRCEAVSHVCSESCSVHPRSHRDLLKVR